MYKSSTNYSAILINSDSSISFIQLLLFHFQKKQAKHFFELVEETLSDSLSEFFKR
ncbi:hypothetical protein HMPREF0813_00596 [Streptococcus anginosus F0211]|uniref:Transposase n=2 Tax=Streptococcus anginosus TaxID=1328 RepID=E6J026_STRAP|nr:hypothetical protein SanJ4206_0530c [Streptococcus anginosus]EFU22763.1 hypothetical protein HMPREF0813_00596 [Streptococcus anginosus F0211]EJP27002.1 hypothetical protein HMPREF1126_0278 [Streptococcus anginosus SK1138]ETS95966.1 hypothetical protein HMPREF1512_1522 [Streptococcus sp. OBRC6]EUB18958.1 hypothetical protein HMPREF1510_1338 [Streptococcus sp. ACC21]EUC77018.1 hypothetical protein HMPREF1511_1289 [Streptococcus sp. CM7]EWC99020.1 hypothetical protein HMPREF1509_1376 [Strepto